MDKLASLVAQTVKNQPVMRQTWVPSLGREDPLEKERLPTPVFLLRNAMYKGAWQAAVYRVTRVGGDLATKSLWINCWIKVTKFQYHVDSFNSNCIYKRAINQTSLY